MSILYNDIRLIRCLNMRCFHTKMVNSSIIAKLCVLSTIALHLAASSQPHRTDPCREHRCNGNHGPTIRFPFRVPGIHPSECGSPAAGFEVSCTQDKQTLLELPQSVKLFVKSIDYKAQYLQVYATDDCLRAHLKSLNMSSSPFRGLGNDSDDYAYFNCSRATASKDFGKSMKAYRVACLDHVYAVNSGDSIDEFPLLSCSKMYTVSAPYALFRQTHYAVLYWDQPVCRGCEAGGGRCSPNPNSTTQGIQCLGPYPQKKINGKILAGSITGSFVLPMLVALFYIIYKSQKLEKETQLLIKKFLDDYKALRPTRLSYAHIKKITNHFKDELGRGAYGTVFKGNFDNKFQVAVKLLDNSSQGNGEDFINEVGAMAKIHHVNVVRLVGFCADGFRRALVYEFLPNGSLQKYISSSGAFSLLGWDKLQKIALGVAKGIEYLHQGCDQRILHFDIKPNNILLDENFVPKISDFGLAKLCAKDQSIVSMTTVKGTVGYMAPEVFSRNFGDVSYKADVYSFGMLLLDMVGGKRDKAKAAEENVEQVNFPEWIYNLLEQGEDIRIHVDQEEEEGKIAKKLGIIGLWCIQWHPVHRPSMKTVIQMLEGEEDELTMPPNPFTSTGPKTHSTGARRRQQPKELEAISETHQEIDEVE